MRTTMLRSLLFCSLLAACTCSDYFTPWKAFQKPAIDPDQYPPVMENLRPLNPGDTMGGTFLGAGKSNWYAIPARKDSTYVATLYPQFDAEYMVIRGGDYTAIASGTGSSFSSYNYTRAIWIAETSDTTYLRVSGAYSSDSGMYNLSLKTFQDVFGSAVDNYETDSKTRAQQLYPKYFDSIDPFTIRRLAVGDTDWFYFGSDLSYHYTIRTVGNADTKIGLLSIGGDSVIASDDNSGGAMNAKLTAPPSSSIFDNRYFFVTGGTDSAFGVYGVSVMYAGVDTLRAPLQ